MASAAKFTRTYLHLQSDANTCGGKGLHTNARCFGWPYQYVLYAGLFGILAVVAIVLAMTLLVFRIRVAENTFRFLGLIGFIILLTFWIFSLALSGFNGLLKLTGATVREPFPNHLRRDHHLAGGAGHLGRDCVLPSYGKSPA